MDADVVVLENASEIHVQRLARDVLVLKSGKDLVFLAVDGSVKLAGRDQVFRTSTLRQDLHEKRSTRMFFQGRTGLSRKTNTRMTQKPETISGIFLGTIFIVPNERLFLVPLKYIDVVRRTHALDVVLESRVDYWSVDGGWDLSGPWTGFTQFTILSEKPPTA